MFDLSHPKVFLRDATGLVREISSSDALILAIGGIIGPSWVIGFASMWFLFPGVNLGATFAILGILCVLHGLYYIMISTAMPRSGGGAYVPLTRLIHPAFGLGMSFLMVLAYTLNLSLVCIWTLTSAVVSPLSTYATVTNNSGLLALASALGTPTWLFAVGTLVIIIVTGIAIGGTRLIMRINKICIVVATAGLVVLYGVVLSTTQDQFKNVYNNYLGSPNAYANMTSIAHSAGLSIPSNWVSPTLLCLPIGFFLITGYQIGAYYSGEIKRVNRSMPIAVIGSIIYGAVVFASMAFLMERTFGGDFIKSAVYLYNIAPSQYPLSMNIAPYVTSLIVLVNSNPFFVGLMIISFLMFAYLLAIGFVFIGSRHFLAWSFDRVFPSALAQVSERFHTPSIALVCLGVIAWIGLGAYVFLPTLLGPVNLTFLFVAAWMFDGLAGIALPWRGRSIFERSLPFVQKKVAGIPLIAIAGAYDLILVILLFIAALMNPAAAGPFGLSTMATIFGAFVVGVVFYYAMKTYHAQRGLDITFAFREIPPE
jgi:amino acid transporter